MIGQIILMLKLIIMHQDRQSSWGEINEITFILRLRRYESMKPLLNDFKFDSSPRFQRSSAFNITKSFFLNYIMLFWSAAMVNPIAQFCVKQTLLSYAISSIIKTFSRFRLYPKPYVWVTKNQICKYHLSKLHVVEEATYVSMLITIDANVLKSYGNCRMPT